MTNASGTVTDSYTYDAFGALASGTGSTTNAYLYTGQQFDDLTGLYSLRARNYNPALGRFLSQDTAAVLYGNPFELNRYGYVANNPINALDPTGFSGLWEKVSIEAQAKIAVGALVALGCYFYCDFDPRLLTDLLGQMVEDLVDELADRGLEHLTEEEESQAQSQTDADTRDETVEEDNTQRLHVALGWDPYLNAFTLNRQDVWTPLGVDVGMWEQWGGMQLVASDVYTNFPAAFQEAIDPSLPPTPYRQAHHIHFNLEGIVPTFVPSDPDPYNEYIQTYGGGGDYDMAQHVTAWELWQLQNHPTACSMTSFYLHGSWDVVPSWDAWRQICGN